MQLFTIAITGAAIITIAIAAIAYFAKQRGNEKLFRRTKKKALETLIATIGLIIMAILFSNLQKKLNEAFDPEKSPLIKHKTEKK